MATGSSYCTERDLLDIYPAVVEFDTKQAVLGWVVDSGSLYVSKNCGLVTQLFADGRDLGAAQASSGACGTNGKWFYDSSTDEVFYFNNAANPNHMNMEAGEDYATLITRNIKNASRYFDSRVDATLPRDQWKDKEGNFDYLVIRTTALFTCAFMIRSADPQSPDAMKLIEEAEYNVKIINGGGAKLSHQNTADSSQGVLREVVSPQNANPLRIVDTRGNFYGTYELFKVYIDTGDGGALGTAKYTVKSKDSSSLKADITIDSDTINGDWQDLGKGLEIRFAGANDSAVATAGDEWEIECHGMFEKTENAQHGYTKMTRGDIPYRVYRKGII